MSPTLDEKRGETVKFKIEEIADSIFRPTNCQREKDTEL
jgi:hypothetical protein